LVLGALSGETVGGVTAAGATSGVVAAWLKRLAKSSIFEAFFIAHPCKPDMVLSAYVDSN
jgi:hypothetical protein